MAGDEYDYWLFDLDGTLVDVDPAYPRELLREVGDRLGHSFADREIDVLWYGLGDARRDLLDRRGVDPTAFWATFHQVEDPQTRAEATYLYDDAESFIGDLDEPAGLVTHCQEYLTTPLLRELEIHDWFETVVCCDDDVGWKPDPSPVELAQTQLGVGYNGHRGVLAGDDPADVGAAWNAGIDALHVQRYDPEARGHCVVGDHRVERFDEL